MRIYYDPDQNQYYSENENRPETAELFLAYPFSAASYKELNVDAYNFVKALALCEEEETSIENMIEDWQNGYVFTCNNQIWLRNCDSISELMEGICEHAIYFRTEEELNAYISDTANDWEISNEEVRNELFDKHHGDVTIAKISFGGYGGYVSC